MTLKEFLQDKTLSAVETVDGYNLIVNVYIDESNHLLVIHKKDGTYTVYQDSVGYMIFNLYAKNIWGQAANPKTTTTNHVPFILKEFVFIYFIINKANSTNKNYSKVAVHFDNAGKPHFWDSQDSLMNERESEILKYAFPELIEAINQDYNKFKMGALDRLLIETFNQVGENSSEKKNYLNSKNDLSVYFRGFRNTPNRAEGLLSISLFTPEGNKLIDQYRVFIKYKSKNNEQFTASVSFVGEEDYLENFQDFELDGWGIDTTYLIMRTPAETAEGVRRHISQRVLDHIQDNPKLMKMVAGTSNVWRPDRFNYGYTFGKNKGLIKKLVNYLEKGEIGTKLDFLESIGKLKTKVIDGKKLYSHSYSDKFFPSSQFRGQFSSFFASAKLAGILGYRKIGKDYFLVKGPNFEAFKSGKLKAEMTPTTTCKGNSQSSAIA